MKLFTSAAYLSLFWLGLASPGAHGMTDEGLLKIRVSASRSSVCVGDKALSVDIIVTNEGTSKAIFDSRRVDINVGYAALFDTTTLKRRTEGMSVQQDRIRSASDRPAMVELQPNQAYVRPISLSLPTPFFSQPGFYLLMPAVSIGSASHRADPKAGVIIEVRDCE